MRRALHALSHRDWRGAREAAAQRHTLAALADRGLVRCAWTHRPHRRLVARLTPAGVVASDRAGEPRLLEAHVLDALELHGPDGITLYDLADRCGPGISHVALNAALLRLERRVRFAGGRYFAASRRC